VRPSTAPELKRQAVREAASRFLTGNLRVVGSVVLGAERDGSDLDLLVNGLAGTTFFDLGGLQVELEELLGVPVYVLTAGGFAAESAQVRVLGEACPV